MRQLSFMFVFVICIGRNVCAQNFENRSTGFFLDFSISCLNNFTPNSGGIAYDGYNGESTFFNGQYLEVRNPGTVNFNGFPVFMGIPYVDGSYCRMMHLPTINDHPKTTLNLSGENSKVIVYARANTATQVKFFLGYTGDTDPITGSNSSVIPAKIMSLTTNLSAYEFDFASWSARDYVDVYGFIIKEPNATVYIEKIIFGDAVVPSSYANKIKGKVFADDNLDCTFQHEESPLNKVLVKASTGTHSYFGFSDVDGSYTIAVDGGKIDQHTVSQQLNERNKLMLSDFCPVSHELTTNSFSTDFCCYNFGNTVRDCSLLNVEISSDRRRRCFTNNTVVEYTNYGTVAETNVEVKVVYPQYVVPVRSTPAWTSIVGDTLIYSIEDFLPGASGRIFIIDSVKCGMEEIRYMTQCTQAIISPKSTCITESPLWDRSSVAIEGKCERGQSYFKVKNVGDKDMGKVSTCRVYLSDTLIYRNHFRLAKDEFFTIRYPYQGSTIRVEADQSEYHPGMSKPSFTLEGCVGDEWLSPITGFVTTAPQDELDDNYAVSCLPILDSYDPNDKSVSPKGKGEQNKIMAGDRLLYTIRFQNTGTDIAYNVKVVDTLSTKLEYASLLQGVSSHDYRMEVSGKDIPIVTYYFDDINLPDSTSNEPASHGFVSFYINTLASLADGVHIKNSAGIYFDYNSPIITNTVSQAIGTYSITDFSKGKAIEVVGIEKEVSPKVNIYPNPTAETVNIEVQNLTEGEFFLYSATGVEKLRVLLNGDKTLVDISMLMSGIYLYKIRSQGGRVEEGKLCVK